MTRALHTGCGLVCLMAFLLLEGCDPASIQPETSQPVSKNDKRYTNVGKLFGESGLTIGQDKDETGIGVNAYLWRGALDCLSAFPLNTTDPFGGVVITDWFSMPHTPDEQFKINVLILSRQLRSDGLKVNVTRRKKGKDGTWQTIPAHLGLQRHFQEVILLRARNFKSKQG